MSFLWKAATSQFQEYFSNINFLTPIVLLNFKLVYGGVYCLATKPQTTLPSDLIMQPVTFDMNTEHQAMYSHTKSYTKSNNFYLRILTIDQGYCLYYDFICYKYEQRQYCLHPSLSLKSAYTQDQKAWGIKCSAHSTERARTETRSAVAISWLPTLPTTAHMLSNHKYPNSF